MSDVMGLPRAAQGWARLRPIRTASRVELEFDVFTQDPFEFQRIGPEGRAALGALGDGRDEVSQLVVQALDGGILLFRRGRGLFV